MAPPSLLLLIDSKNSDAQGQLTAAVDELLDQLQGKFDTVSKEMFGKCMQSFLCLISGFRVLSMI